MNVWFTFSERYVRWAFRAQRGKQDPTGCRISKNMASESLWPAKDTWCRHRYSHSGIALHYHDGYPKNISSTTYHLEPIFCGQYG